MQVPRQRTPLTPAEMAPVFARAYEALMGSAPSRALAEVGLAIIGLENAQGQSIYGHNWGNIMWTGSGDWFPAKKIIEGQPTRWQAEPSHDAGARSWWSLVLRKYKPVVDAARRGDARAAVRALYAGGYVVAVRRPEWTDDQARRAAAAEQQRYAAGVERMARGYRDQGLFASLAGGAEKLGGWLFLAAAAIAFAWGWRKGKPS